MTNVMKYPLLVFVLSFFVMWLSVQIGAFFRRRQRRLDEEMREDIDLVLAATLTLLGLIIGFSFSMAISRYDQRKNYEEAEANAIGTEYVRADLLPAADAAKVRALLRNYIDQRVLFYMTRDGGTDSADQCPHCSIADRAVDRGPGSGCNAADARDRPGRFGYERCIELAGIHAGCLVEPNPNCGMVSDGSNRHLLQCVGRLLCAKC
jgi:hypothetical protein